MLVPPGWDRRYTEVFGFTLEEIGAEGARLARDQAAQRRAADRGRCRGPPIFSPGLDAARARQARPAARARRDPRREDGPPAARPGDDAGDLPDAARRARPARRCRREPGTIQWDFADADPWHLVVANGDTRVEPGRVEAPTVTIQCRYEDWVDLLGGREHPLKLAATRRLRPKGDLQLAVAGTAHVPRVMAAGARAPGPPRWDNARAVPERAATSAPHHRVAAAADPLPHGQPAGQRGRGPGMAARPARAGRLRVRAARRRARPAQPDRPAALGLRRSRAVPDRPRRHRARRSGRVERGPLVGRRCATAPSGAAARST